MRALVAAALAAVAALVAACGDSGSTARTVSGPLTVAVTTGQAGDGALAILGVRGALAPSVTRAFARRSGCAVRVRTVADAAAAVRSLTADPAGADVLALPAADVGALVHRGLLGAVDDSQVAGWQGLDSHLQQAVTGTDGEHDAVPYLWSANVLLTARAAAPSGTPRSARPVYAPTNGRRLAMPDSPYDLADAATYLSFPNPFALTPEQITSSAELLRRQHPFILRYTTSVAQLERLMRDGRVQVALGPARVSEDVPGVVASVPHDGVTGSVEALALSATALHPVCAYRFLGHVLGPRAQAQLAAATGLTPVNPRSCPFLGRRACAFLHTEDEALESVRFAIRPPHWRTWLSAWRSITRS